MPITYTGRKIRPRGLASPSLIDIAVGMSRQPRFAGQGKRWFSVLDHSLFCDELVKAHDYVPILGGDDDEARGRWRLAVLLHDAHEAITADVPTDFKNDELKERQEWLDGGIATRFYPTGTLPEHVIKPIDRRALVAEAHVIGPPVPSEVIVESFGSNTSLSADRALLSSLLADQGSNIGVPPYIVGQDYHPGVKEYIRRVLTLM